MTTKPQSSSPNVFVTAIIGIALMVGGMYLYNQHLPYVESLAKMGVPVDFGKTIATIGVLLILFPVVRLFFISPLQDAISGRTHELERTFGEADALRSDMAQMKKEYEGRLAETEASARAQIQEEIRKAQEVRQQLMTDAAEKAEELKKRAITEIETERQRVLSELRLHAVNLTLGATEQILGENVDDERNRRLIEEFIKTAEVPA